MIRILKRIKNDGWGTVTLVKMEIFFWGVDIEVRFYKLKLV